MRDGFNSDHLDFDWLEPRQSGWQFGEQGVLYSLASLLCLTGKCVEIGGGDGESLPLTIHPFYESGHRCVLFEADESSRVKLKQAYPGADVRGKLTQLPDDLVKEDIAVCVIDVDSIDYYIMQNVLDNQRPSILMVEHFDLASPVRLSHGLIPSVLCGERLANGFVLQQSAIELYRLAEKHEYTRVGLTRVNSIFVSNVFVDRVRK